jgi:5-methylcytosine-specific restriction enzyme subunit McrC
MQVIKLIEEEDLSIPRVDIDENLISLLWQSHKERIDIEFPSIINNSCYQLRSKGCIGQIPVSPEFMLRILPKVPLNSIFCMLEYAYNLKSFQFLEGVAEVESIADLFERLVSILAKKVLNRVRKGLYSGYQKHYECLQFQRGRILIAPTIRAMRRGSAQLECEYEEHTADLIDNQILAWTLYQLPRFGLKREDVRRQVRQAYHALVSAVTLSPITPRDCIKSFYHRLNDDYQPMHSLCRFFLEQCGPGIETGSYSFIPFLLNMPRLFESFVAEWLKLNTPTGTHISPQYRADLDQKGNFFFRIDLVLSDIKSGKILAVLDTKYKRDTKPSAEDIQAIVAYAAAVETNNAFLIYPSSKTEEINIPVGKINVSSLGFDISQDLDHAGSIFFEKLVTKANLN